MTSKAKALGTALESRIVQKAHQAGLEASKQPLSGVLKEYPSDAVVAGGLVEAKVRGVQLDARGQQYIRLDLSWLSKVKKESRQAGFDWGVVVVNPKGSTQPLVLCDLDHFLSLITKTSGYDTVEETDK